MPTNIPNSYLSIAGTQTFTLASGAPQFLSDVRVQCVTLMGSNPTNASLILPNQAGYRCDINNATGSAVTVAIGIGGQDPAPLTLANGEEAHLWCDGARLHKVGTNISSGINWGSIPTVTTANSSNLILINNSGNPQQITLANLGGLFGPSFGGDLATRTATAQDIREITGNNSAPNLSSGGTVTVHAGEFLFDNANDVEFQNKAFTFDDLPTSGDPAVAFRIGSTLNARGGSISLPDAYPYVPMATFSPGGFGFRLFGGNSYGQDAANWSAKALGWQFVIGATAKTPAPQSATSAVGERIALTNEQAVGGFPISNILWSKPDKVAALGSADRDVRHCKVCSSFQYSVAGTGSFSTSFPLIQLVGNWFVFKGTVKITIIDSKSQLTWNGEYDLIANFSPACCQLSTRYDALQTWQQGTFPSTSWDSACLNGTSPTKVGPNVTAYQVIDYTNQAVNISALIAGSYTSAPAKNLLILIEVEGFQTAVNASQPTVQP